MTISVSGKVAKYEKKIQKVDTWVSTALENGLFEAQHNIGLEQITSHLRDAIRSLEGQNPDFASCDRHLFIAASRYFSAATKAGKIWRLMNIYAIHILMYLLFFLLSIFLLYYTETDKLLASQLGITQFAIDAASWGIVGGILRAVSADTK